jgi:Fe-S cluster assembly ATP-binding protein
MTASDTEERTPLLAIDDLHVEVAGREVLKGVSLQIGEREVHAFFGPNGSGKTTLLNSIMGFGNYRITGGKIYFRGKDITHLPVNETGRQKCST